MQEDIDITTAMLTQSTLTDDIAQFRERCLSMPLVKTCDVTLDKIKGRKIDPTHYALSTDASVRIETSMLLKLKIDARGSAILDAPRRMLKFESIEILNDFNGLLTKALQFSGLVVGREGKVARKDCELIQRLLA